MKQQLKDKIKEAKRIKSLVERYKTILSLIQEKFLIKEGTEFYQAELGWDELENVWVICYQRSIEDYYAAHEVGHVYLAKKCNFIGFAKPMSSKDENKIDWNIQPLLNVLLDGFVDFQLSTFIEIYPIVKEKYLDYVQDLENSKWHITDQTDYIELLRWYLVWHQGFHYILKKEDHQTTLSQINALLTFLKSKLLIFTGGITEKNFTSLILELKNFELVKNSSNPKEIISYCSDVILSMHLWDEKHTLNQINIFFYPD